MTGDSHADVFFNGCADGQLMLQKCSSCGQSQFYPRRWCSFCGSPDVDWAVTSGKGEIVTCSVVRRAPSEEHRERVPYVVAIVRLAEGPQMMASIVGSEPDDVRPRCEVRFVASREHAPSFELVT